MDPDGKWTSTRAVLLAAAGQNCWPPAGSYMAATGQDLMAADTLERNSVTQSLSVEPQMVAIRLVGFGASYLVARGLTGRP